MHFDNFELRDGKLYYKGRSTSLMIRGGKLRSFGEIVKMLGKERLHKLGFNILVEDKLTAQQAIMLSRAEEDLPFTSDLAKVNDIELQEVTKNAAKSTANLIEQLEGQETLPMREIQGLDKQLRSMRGSLKVEVAKKVQLQQCTA